jgi:hypothetical protein
MTAQGEATRIARWCLTIHPKPKPKKSRISDADGVSDRARDSAVSEECIS